MSRIPPLVISTYAEESSYIDPEHVSYKRQFDKRPKSQPQAFCRSRTCLTKYPDAVIGKEVDPKVAIPEAKLRHSHCPRCGYWLTWQKGYRRKK